MFIQGIMRTWWTIIWTESRFRPASSRPILSQSRSVSFNSNFREKLAYYPFYSSYSVSETASIAIPDGSPPMTYKDMLTYMVDIQSPPSQRMIRMFADLCTAEGIDICTMVGYIHQLFTKMKRQKCSSMPKKIHSSQISSGVLAGMFKFNFRYNFAGFHASKFLFTI